jgi:hypothetical protein
MKFTFDPPFLPLHTATLILVAAGIAVLLYVRQELRRRVLRHGWLILLRAGTVLGFALLLLNPVRNRAAPESGSKAPFYLLLDTSRSMTTPDAGIAEKTRTRWAAAQQEVLQNDALLSALGQRYELRAYAFDQRLNALPLDALRRIAQPAGDRSALGEAIAQALDRDTARASGQVRGGMLLVSDGRDNGNTSPLETARMARALGIPIFTLCLGQERKERDVQIVARRPQTFAAPAQTVEITAELRAQGLENTTVQVDLLREGRRVQSRTVGLTRGAREVTFPVREAQKGFYRYAVVCSSVSGEADTANNRAHLFLNVMDARARVLIMEGSPTWDVKFLAQTLRDDPTLTVDTIFQLTDTRPFAVAGSPEKSTLKIPRTLSDFTAYDVIVLGKGFEAFFDAAGTRTLQTWIRDRGGHLIFLRGRADERTEALRELEPFTYEAEEIQQARLRLTEAGRGHPGFALRTAEDSQTVVQRLPSLITATRVQNEKALAVVLARAGTGDSTEMAILAYQRYGQGKTLAIAGQGLWRWAFLPPELAQYGQVYADFWTQTIRWLVNDSEFLPGQNLSLRTDRMTYAQKDVVNFLGYVRGVKPATLPEITLTQPDGKTVSIVPAKADGNAADFTATFRPTLPGEYIATMPPLNGTERSVPASASFTVYPGQEEDANRTADPALMQQIAAASGGQALTPADLSSLPERVRAVELASRQTEDARSLWDRGWVLALLVGALGAEWLLRRRIGLA